jgi:hypothetical protein
MKRSDKLKGGLSSLLGENQQENEAPTITGQEAAKAAPTDSEVIEEATPEEEEDLINSVEDEELKAALHKKRMDKRGRPRKDAEERRKESEDYTRFCAIIRKDQIAKLHEICLRETLTIKEIIETLVGEAIEIYEEKHGEVIPKERKGDASKIFKR